MFMQSSSRLKMEVPKGSERPKVPSAKPSAEASVVFPTEAEASVVLTEGNPRLNKIADFFPLVKKF